MCQWSRDRRTDLSPYFFLLLDKESSIIISNISLIPLSFWYLSCSIIHPPNLPSSLPSFCIKTFHNLHEHWGNFQYPTKRLHISVSLSFMCMCTGTGLGFFACHGVSRQINTCTEYMWPFFYFPHKYLWNTRYDCDLCWQHAQGDLVFSGLCHLVRLQYFQG